MKAITEVSEKSQSRLKNKRGSASQASLKSNGNGVNRNHSASKKFLKTKRNSNIGKEKIKTQFNIS